MKRFASMAGLATALAVAASAAYGFNAGFDYRGDVKGDPAAHVGFDVGKDSNGHKLVGGFTVTHPQITCTDSASTRSTDGYRFDLIMQVSHREFSGKGDWVILALDPSGRVDGKFSRDRQRAHGTFRIHGELAGAGTHCKTGELEWRATKQPPSGP